jgi:hypothetical protein
MSEIIIDWLGITYKEDVKLPGTGERAGTARMTDVQTFARYAGIGRDLPVGKGGMGYKLSLEREDGLRIYYNTDTERMGVHVSHPGLAMNNGYHGFDSQQVLEWHLVQGGRVTRLDVAVDVNFEIDVGGLRKSVLDGSAITNVRSVPTLIESDGRTLYIGRRSSEKMLRIYDKAKESGLAGTLWRVEFETKGRAAERLARAIKDEGLETVPQYIKGFFHAPNVETWCRLIGETVSTNVIASEKKRSNTREWLLGFVAPIVAKRSLIEDGFYEEFDGEVRKQIQNELDKQSEILENDKKQTQGLE